MNAFNSHLIVNLYKNWSFRTRFIQNGCRLSCHKTTQQHNTTLFTELRSLIHWWNLPSLRFICSKCDSNCLFPIIHFVLFCFAKSKIIWQFLFWDVIYFEFEFEVSAYEPTLRQSPVSCYSLYWMRYTLHASAYFKFTIKNSLFYTFWRVFEKK